MYIFYVYIFYMFIFYMYIHQTFLCFPEVYVQKAKY